MNREWCRLKIGSPNTERTAIYIHGIFPAQGNLVAGMVKYL